MAQADHVSNASRALVTGAHAEPSSHPARTAHAEFVTTVAGQLPRPMPLFAHAADLENRADHLKTILDAVSVYVTVILDDAAQNVPGGLDLDFAHALLADLESEATGALRRAADAIAEDTGRIA